MPGELPLAVGYGGHHVRVDGHAGRVIHMGMAFDRHEYWNSGEADSTTDSRAEWGIDLELLCTDTCRIAYVRYASVHSETHTLAQMYTPPR